ncbi:terminase small subunit [Candidatus Accumulibacter phosphatis]|uniref:Terminase small subunit n=1 Tax=Candidatus Accumulibacter phosphatis TaxID=327160 RepID=A0ABX1TV87_9PROT|nr:terminase small subunit [Candidatus Accumulibacter phosphatis]NMQ28182.1 terminase small subunit [Candidatus Accumulibacter phosphatis]
MTPRQSRFVDEYLCDLVATKAAIRAGYSPRRASEIGYQLLQKTTVQKAITERMNARAQRTGITQDKVLADLEAVKQSTMSMTADKGGNVLMASHAAALRALELQGRHLGMWKDRPVGPGEVSIADAILQRVAGKAVQGLSVVVSLVSANAARIAEPATE